MKYLYKLLAENLIEQFAIVDNNIVNSILMAIILFISFIPAWNSVSFLYKLGMLKDKNSGSLIHWIIRIITCYLCCLILKGIINFIIWLYNYYFLILILIGLLLGIYLIVKGILKNKKINIQ